ncbi:MAG: hypothetical protein ACD_29C00273G0003 [uncultured bacterium]|nr:MAG: hypothetical protein ACD_29C00273G0003 [uncultured bacterium]
MPSTQDIVGKFNVTDFSALKTELVEAIAPIQNNQLRETAQIKLNSSNVQKCTGQLDLITLACILAEMGYFPNKVKFKESDACSENDYLIKNAPVYYFPLLYDLKKAASNVVEMSNLLASLTDQASQVIQTVVTNVTHYAEMAVKSAADVVANSCSDIAQKKIRSYLFPHGNQQHIKEPEPDQTAESSRSSLLNLE